MMAENTSLKVTGEAAPVSESSPKVKKRSGSFRLSPSRDSSAGSNSSSPRIGRARTGPSLTTVKPDDDSAGTHSGAVSDGEKLDSSSGSSFKKKAKDKDKKGFFGVSIMNIFSAPHHHKNQEMHKIFSSLPGSEKLVDDYSCALQRDILIHGRLYVTQSWLCFYANIFSWETLITIPFKSVRAITKEKTVMVIPNAIQVSVSSEKYGFTSLVNRDVTYNIIFKCWQNNLLDQPLSPLELVKAARKAYGESTDVGTEADLWGQEAAEKEDKKSLTKQVSMPTYVEIGRIPPNSGSSTTSLDTANNTPPVQRQSLPVGTPNGLDAAAKPAVEPLLAQSVPNSLNLNRTEENHNTPPVNFESPSSSDGRTVIAADYLDKGSIGGESGTEYETVSLIEETGEVPCNCSEHIGRTILNDVYNTDVETIFRLMFTDSDFLRNFNKAEKTINVETGEWQVQPDSSRLRDLSYTVALNYSFGPKFTHTTEHQVYSKSGQPGLKHIVDTEVVNHNIPYGDTFYTVCRYCVTRVAHKKTRFRVTANIKFKKSCWGLVKNLIERNAGDGLRTHYTHLDTALKEHVASLDNKHSRAHRRASRPSLTSGRRHKRPAKLSTPATPVVFEAEMNGQSRDISPIGTKTESRPSSSAAPDKSDDEKLQGKKSIPHVNLALTILLGVLIVSNMLLYQHLLSYTSNTDVTTPNPPPLPMDNIEAKSDVEWPITKEEWQSFLQQQLATRSKETGQLKEALFNFIQTLDTIENSINLAKKELLSSLNSWNGKISPSDTDQQAFNIWSVGAPPTTVNAREDHHATNPGKSAAPPDNPTMNPKVSGAPPKISPESPTNPQAAGVPQKSPTNSQVSRAPPESPTNSGEPLRSPTNPEVSGVPSETPTNPQVSGEPPHSPTNPQVSGEPPHSPTNPRESGASLDSTTDPRKSGAPPDISDQHAKNHSTAHESSQEL